MTTHSPPLRGPSLGGGPRASPGGSRLTPRSGRETEEGVSPVSIYNISVTRNKLTPLAQTLRRKATREEQRLWYDFLSTYPFRFRRQVVIGKYIVDFYCSQARLAIELDGGQHYEETALIRDNERTQWLQDSGILVLRFLNSDVRNNLYDVCSTIDAVVKGRLKERAK